MYVCRIAVAPVGFHGVQLAVVKIAHIRIIEVCHARPGVAATRHSCAQSAFFVLKIYLKFVPLITIMFYFSGFRLVVFRPPVSR